MKHLRLQKIFRKQFRVRPPLFQAIMGHRRLRKFFRRQFWGLQPQKVRELPLQIANPPWNFGFWPQVLPLRAPVACRHLVEAQKGHFRRKKCKGNDPFYNPEKRGNYWKPFLVHEKIDPLSGAPKRQNLIPKMYKNICFDKTSHARCPSGQETNAYFGA